MPKDKSTGKKLADMMYGSDQMRATPQSRITGPVANALRKAQQFASQYELDPRIPLLGGTGVDELLSLPEAASLMEDVSYNGPGALIRGGNAATGGLGTFRPDPRTVSAADVALTASGLGSLGAKAARAAPGALKAGARNLSTPRTMSPEAGAIVYHGSPHKFDKFSSKKIGTGEGAQAYGHGLYFAESPEVAKTYQPRSPQFEEKLIKLYQKASSTRNYPMMEVLEDAMMHRTPNEIVEKFTNADDGYTGQHAKAAQDFVNWYAKNEPEVGGLYTVDLPDEKIAQMLDYDKPLSAQSPEVKRVLMEHPDVLDYIAKAEAQRVKLNEMSPVRLEKIPSASAPYDESRMAGKDVMTAIAQRSGLGKSQGAIEEELRQLGIPGIRYLDEQSRGSKGAEGTSNFVVFPGEEDALNIIDRKKEGGSVHISDNPDVMALELAKGGAIRMQAGGVPGLVGRGINAVAKALKPAKEEVKPSLVIKNKPGIIVSDLIDEDPEIAKRMGALARAKRQAAIEAEGKRQEAARQTQPSVGYRKSTPQNPDPLVGTRFINEAPFGLNPNDPFDLSKFKGASGLVLPWDSQSRNVKTTQVSGMDLPNQIFRQTHGGVPYSFDTQHAAKGIVGASGEEIAKRVKTRSENAIRENKDRGGTGELLHFPITMGFRGEDYALPYSEFSFDIINHKLMTGELTQKQADELTNMVRNYTPPEKKYQGKKPFSEFAGFTSPEGLDQIYTGQGLKVPSGELRKAIADRIIWQKGSQERLGFNAEDLMNATTYEPLRGVDKGFIGSSVMRNTPSGMRLSPSAGKYPYDTDFSGEHLGRLEDNVNAEALFYRTLNPVKRELMDRETKKPYTRESLSRAALAAIEKRNENVSQMIDQQFLDDYDTYITELRKPTEYRKGGAVRMAGGGEVHGLSTADLLFLQSQEDLGKLPAHAQREAITNMGGQEVRQRMAGKMAAGGEITADDLILEERKL